MMENNHTPVTSFILLGFTEDPYTQTILFIVFLVIYLVNVVGNLGMILMITTDSQLHTPMYKFLRHLSFCDLCYSTTTVPKLLAGFVSQRQTIPFSGCAAQFFFFAVFVTASIYILAAMAYDRYVVICNPLLYSMKMSNRVCAQLIAACYSASCVNAIIHTGATFSLSFCSSKVNHFFCDMPAVLALSCFDTHINEILLYVFGSFVEIISLSIIFTSYLLIMIAILRIRSAQGRRKAFLTCASHFTGVTLLFGTIIFMYMRPTSTYSFDQDKWASVFYTIVIPMLNPLIYSLRNKNVKDAFRKIFSGKLYSA
ncbi:olfactory receptor 5AR1-like [Alligator mississippiensis]|uniref:olfactory receptor 5AR1-like n=1 Tax=Alligator mississippiensis TaxID=8496 RepID=UPI0003D0EA64|nr:olfactory receptor 5AR1-like [Alligator mississippiensis]